jgi:hypothetical protein
MTAKGLMALVSLLAVSRLCHSAGPPPLPWPAPEADALRGAGISPRSADVLAYIRAMTPSAAEGAALAALVRGLGDDDFRARQTAAKKLTSASAAPTATPKLPSAPGRSSADWDSGPTPA